MPRLLVVQHAPTPSLQAIGEAVVAGACDPALGGLEVVVRTPLETSADEMLSADGYVLGCAAHFGYMAGAMKDLFDRVFLAVGGQLDEHGGAGDAPGTTAKRPFGLWVHGRYDTTGAVRSVTSITGALGWRQAAEELEVVGDVDEPARQAAYELGATLGAVLLA